RNGGRTSTSPSPSRRSTASSRRPCAAPCRSPSRRARSDVRRALPLAALLAALLIAAAFAGPAPRPHADRLVILMTIDGFPAWLWKEAAPVMPNLARLAKEGATADAMTVSDPSITWPNHPTLLTGVPPEKPGVGSTWPARSGAPGEPPHTEAWRPKSEFIRVPTLYDVAYRAGLRTAEVDWIPILKAGTIHDELLEIPEPDGP